MWQASRVRPARALARIPARASLASAPGMSAETIALLSLLPLLVVATGLLDAVD